MKNVLEAYVGQRIGMNFRKPFHVDAVRLVAVAPGHFSVRELNNDNVRHFTWSSVVQVVENPAGIETGGGLFTHSESFAVVVKVGHLLEYAMA